MISLHIRIFGYIIPYYLSVYQITYACYAGSLFNAIATKTDKFYTATILVPYFPKKEKVTVIKVA